jgi:hypothetical protein
VVPDEEGVTPPVLIALFGFLGGGMLGLYALLRLHQSDCEQRRIAAESRIKALEVEMERAKADMLTARASIHDLRGQVTPVVIDYQQRHER